MGADDGTQVIKPNKVISLALCSPFIVAKSGQLIFVSTSAPPNLKSGKFGIE